MKHVKVLLLAATVLLFSGLTAMVTAQETGNDDVSGQGLEVSPPLLELEADPGETIQAEIGVRNITRTDVIASVTVNDFVAKDETGQPRILLDNDEESPYPLAAYVAAIPDLLIAPTEQEVVEVEINVPADASPGGHFGVVRFSARPADPNIDSSGVAISASIGTLILLNVSGDVEEELSVAEMFVTKDGEAGNFFETGPFTFVSRLENTGNVHLQPVGELELTNVFGKEVATIDFNDNERNVLPRSIRRFEHDFEDKSFWFGRYTLTANLQYGADSTALSASTDFWVIPYKLVAVALLMLVAVIFFSRKALKVYSSHVVRKYHRDNSGNQTHNPPGNPDNQI